MINQIDNPQTASNRRTVLGIIILGIGAMMLLSQVSFLAFPFGLISWPLAIIGLGLYTGYKHNFRKPIWILYTMIGVIFLLPNIIPSFSASLVWPLLLIAFGVSLLARRTHRWTGDHWEKRMDKHNFDNSIE